MSFFKQRDFDLFQSINKELVNDFVETPVIIYKLDLGQSETNMYGESVGGKSYKVGFQVNCYISRENQSTNYEGFGSDVTQTIQFRFLRSMLEGVQLVLQVGDIINFNDAYFEIDSIVENELIAGNINFSNSIIVDTHMRRRSGLNIEELY